MRLLAHLFIASIALPSIFAHALPPKSLVQGLLEGFGLEQESHNGHGARVASVLGQIGVSIGHTMKGIGETGHSLLEGLPFTFLVMLFCLIGIPFLLTAGAFIFFESKNVEAKPPQRSHTPATQTPIARATAPRLSAPPSAAVLGNQAVASAVYGQFATSNAEASRQGSRSRTRSPMAYPLSATPAPTTNGYTNGHISHPPSLMSISRVGTMLPDPRPSTKEDERPASPLSTGLIVKNPAGVHVRFDGQLLPHPEQRTLNILSMKDGQVILCAHVRETSESSFVSVETKDLPIALLDTTHAITLPGFQRASRHRRVVVHRVVGEEYETPGAACAYVVPGSSGTFLVFYFPDDTSPAVIVYTKTGTTWIDSMVDAKGNLMAKSQVPGSGSREQPGSLWVKQGVDMALIACIAISMQKLGSGSGTTRDWTKDLLEVQASSRSLVTA